MGREIRLVANATVTPIVVNDVMARATWVRVCRRLPINLFMSVASVTGTTPSVTLMPQVLLAGTWTNAAGAGLTFTAAGSGELAMTLLPTADDNFRVIASAVSGTTPGVTGLDVIARCNRQ